MIRPLLAATMLATAGPALAHGVHATTLDGELPHRGIAFDVTAEIDLELMGLGVRLQDTVPREVTVWTVEGSSTDHATDPGAWTRVARASLGSPDPRGSAFLTFDNHLPLEEGDTLGLFVQVEAPGALMTSEGAEAGAVHAVLAGQVAVHTGVGLDAPFSEPAGPRVFNGHVSFQPAGNKPPFGRPQDLSTRSDTPLDIALEAVDPDSHHLTYAIEEPPAHGRLEPAAGEGRWRYVPDRSFGGEDRFTFTVDDGEQRSRDAATVVIDVERVEDPGEPPVADPGDPGRTVEGTPLPVDGSGSTDPDGTVVAWQWDCDGDGTFDVTGRTARCPMPDDGRFDLVLQVTDDRGNTDRATATVVVDNAPPTVRLARPPVAVEGEPATLTASVRDPGIADEHVLTWAFGDGGPPLRGPDSTVEHAWPDEGRYEVVVTATDDDGGEGTTRRPIRVLNVPPVLERVQAPEQGRVGEPLAFSAAARDVDEDLVYTWEFGDGSTATGATVEHRFTEPFLYPVVLFVDDGTDVTSRILQVDVAPAD